MILITGASAGIGEALARKYGELKNDLILIARREERLQELASELRKECGVEVACFAFDITNRSSTESFFEKQANLLKKVSVLVNNAGLAKGADPFQIGTLDDFEVMLETNVNGLIRMTRLMLPYFLANQSGHIVNLGSVAGRWIYPRGNVYCATKAAVHAFSEALRLDLNGTPIRVTEIIPGMVETEFSEVRFRGDVAKAKSVYANMTPLTSDDVAEAVVWATSRPSRVNVAEIVIYPTDQASPTVVHRKP